MPVTIHDEGVVATVRIDRAHKANALDDRTAHELASAIESCSEARVVVLEGAPKGNDPAQAIFCAGADVRQMEALEATDAADFIRAIHAACRAARCHPAPVIGKVRGAALGAGLELMVSCDFAIVATDARLGMPEPFVGLPSVVEAALLPTTIGLMRTKDLLLTGENLTAAEAERAGLVTSTAAPEELDEAVDAKIEQLVRHPRGALAHQKALLNHWLNHGLDDAIENSVAVFQQAVASGEPKAAIADYWSK